LRIGINTRFLLSDKMEGFGWYTYEVVRRIVRNHPEHEFILFFDRKADQKFKFGSNCTEIVLNPQARHPLLYLVWFEWSLKRALKKNKIDALFSPDGSLVLGSSIPQINVIHDINFEHYPEDLPGLAGWYYRKYFPKYANHSQKIITVSQASKEDIVSTYKINPDKIEVAWNGASEKFRVFSNEEIESFRTENNLKPYFLFVGSIHPRKNVQRLVNSFALFMEQNSFPTIDLVIVGKPMWKGNTIEIPESVKNSIRFTGHLPQEKLVQYTASAFALTYVPYFEGFGIPLVEAMKCGIPILSGNKTSLPEIAGDAAIYCNPFDEKDISDGMQQIFQDYELRLKLKNNGIERAKLFSWEITAENVWTVITNHLNSRNQRIIF
jgi:glycosyltransferase involved in cell wall biosynthesis